MSDATAPKTASETPSDTDGASLQTVNIAISLAHGAALGRLLRAHGRDDHAGRLDAALAESVRILAEQLDQGELGRALRWVEEQVGQPLPLPDDIRLH